MIGQMIGQMSRPNQILALVLIFQLVVLGVVFWPRPAAGMDTADRLLADLDPGRVTRLSLLDAQGQEIVLARVAGEWVLPASDDYPIRSEKAGELLEKLQELKANRLVTETQASHRRLMVAGDSFERLITVEQDDGRQFLVYLGSSPSFNVAHMRRAGVNQVYLVSGITLSDVATSITSWIDTLFVSVPRDEIVAMTLENAQGRFRFTRDDAGEWLMDDLGPDETLNVSTVSGLASRAGSLYIMRPLGLQAKAEYGLDQPQATLTVQRKTEEGVISTYAISVGAQSPEDNSYAVGLSESPYYVRVAEYTARDLVEWGREDFLQIPPTPTPAAEEQEEQE